MIRDRVENINITLVLVGLLAFMFLFLQINFSETLGSTFVGLSVITGLLYLFDVFTGKRTIEIEREINRERSVSLAFIGYLAYAFLTFILISLTNWATTNFGLQSLINLSQLQAVVNLNSLAEVFKTTVQALIFQGSMWLSISALSFPVAMIESLGFFVVAPELFFYDRQIFGYINPFELGVKLIAVFFLISVGFMAYHFNAKGLSDNAALVATFSFALVSLFLISVEGQALSALLLHISSNFSALIQQYNLFPNILKVSALAMPIVQVIVTVGAVLVTFYLSSKYIPRLVLGGER